MHQWFNIILNGLTLIADIDVGALNCEGLFALSRNLHDQTPKQICVWELRTVKNEKFGSFLGVSFLKIYMLLRENYTKIQKYHSKKR